VDSLTVVIPTYNREGTLKKALEGYLGQSEAQSIQELLVVDDGSTDCTEAMVRRIGTQAPFPIHYFRQANQGPAAARNFGIKKARAPIILFTDSDIVPDCNLVSQHLKWHRENPERSTAVLGYVTWPPEPKPTPFMRWYGEGGTLFSYGRFKPGCVLTVRDFYTCNLSLKAEFLRTCGQFDEDFKDAAYEDIELGYRLSKFGLRLLYNPEARAYHHQFFSFAAACRKAIGNKRAAQVFLQKEAGRLFLEPRLRRRSRLWFRIAKLLTMGIATALSPVRRLLDSHIPLPGILYRLFFWYDATRPVDPLSEKS